jgi:DNA-binding transcriptional MocR family regulator
MPPHWHAADLAEHAARSGIAVVPSSAFAVASPVAEAVRISLGAAPDRSALTQGLKRLSELLVQPVLPARAII